jgi:hypothetical protein
MDGGAMSVKLNAKFVLTASGDVDAVERGGKHYKIELGVDKPKDVMSAVYRLDPSYWDPVREVSKRNSLELKEPITSYGDFDVEATFTLNDGKRVVVRERLSDAISRTYERENAENPMPQPLARALELLKEK